MALEVHLLFSIFQKNFSYLQNKSDKKKTEVRRSFCQAALVRIFNALSMSQRRPQAASFRLHLCLPQKIGRM
jgi:hypothetical protein